MAKKLGKIIVAGWLGTITVTVATKARKDTDEGPMEKLVERLGRAGAQEITRSDDICYDIGGGSGKSSTGTASRRHGTVCGAAFNESRGTEARSDRQQAAGKEVEEHQTLHHKKGGRKIKTTRQATPSSNCRREW